LSLTISKLPGIERKLLNNLLCSQGLHPLKVQMKKSRVGKSPANAHSSCGDLDPTVTPAHRDDLTPITFHLTIFNIFLGLTFAYFVYFSHQITGTQTEMVAKITEINAINVPHPWGFLTLTGHKEYYYTKRRDVLREEFRLLKQRIDDSKSTDEELAECGKEIQRVITQIAYFFPYKKMLDYEKDGSATFDPNTHDAIDTKEPLNIGFLKTQIDEIYNWNYAFTLELKDGRDRIAKAMILAGKFKDDSTKSRVVKYLDSLIDYLDKHYQLAIPLGLMIKRYEFLLSKTGKAKIIVFTVLLTLNFLCGVLIPLFLKKWRRTIGLEIVTQLSFVVGIFLLFREALYSLPF